MPGMNWFQLIVFGLFIGIGVSLGFRIIDGIIKLLSGGKP